MSDYHTYSFERLEVWKLAREVKKEMYLISMDFPKSEIYGLTSQIRRSAGSISANIAEGSGRAGIADRAHFVNLAYSSGMELLDHIITAKDLNYLDEKKYLNLRKKLDELLNKLNAFYRYQLKHQENLKRKFDK